MFHLWEAYKKRILGECLLILSLPGKTSRMLVDIARLAERFKMRLVNLISNDPNLVLYLSAYQVDLLFKLANLT